MRRQTHFDKNDPIPFCLAAPLSNWWAVDDELLNCYDRIDNWPGRAAYLRRVNDYCIGRGLTLYCFRQFCNFDWRFACGCYCCCCWTLPLDWLPIIDCFVDDSDPILLLGCCRSAATVFSFAEDDVLFYDCCIGGGPKSTWLSFRFLLGFPPSLSAMLPSPIKASRSSSKSLSPEDSWLSGMPPLGFN